mmetsp:Transcript_78471/g.221872  ORF Transcript_78471/g.221872 Transcript_78471/m.221872 type:complete len:187 (+) Transcript_78471:109-669(+)
MAMSRLRQWCSTVMPAVVVALIASALPIDDEDTANMVCVPWPVALSSVAVAGFGLDDGMGLLQESIEIVASKEAELEAAVVREAAWHAVGDREAPSRVCAGTGLEAEEACAARFAAGAAEAEEEDGEKEQLFFRPHAEGAGATGQRRTSGASAEPGAEEEEEEAGPSKKSWQWEARRIRGCGPSRP